MGGTHFRGAPKKVHTFDKTGKGLSKLAVQLLLIIMLPLLTFFHDCASTKHSRIPIIPSIEMSILLYYYIIIEETTFEIVLEEDRKCKPEFMERKRGSLSTMSC